MREYERPHYSAAVPIQDHAELTKKPFVAIFLQAAVYFVFGREAVTFLK
ncbi:MAG: hypothetical protein JWO06_2526 [Bacteroidota bacterium]|nr:hypothetical protein [Bacteroidota bacterium]